MPSYTSEQKDAALKALEECGGSVTRAMRMLGYPCRQTFYSWINESDELHQRTAGRPFSHYDPALKREAVRLVHGGMAGADVAQLLGISSSAVVHNWARKASEPKMPAQDRRPIVPNDSDERAFGGFDGDESERIRQLELENDILREAVRLLKAGGLGQMTNRENTLVIDRLRQTGRYTLRELTDSLRISKSSYEYQRTAMAKPDKYAEARAMVRKVFEEANGSRGYRYVLHGLRERGLRISEKVVRRLMAEEGLCVAYAKKRLRRYSSYAGEISKAPPNLVRRDFRSGLPNSLWLTDITEFGLKDSKVYLSAILDCFDGALVAWSIGTAPDANLANSSLIAACAVLGDGDMPVLHSDRGAHYRWDSWDAICRENRIVRSMSRKGCTPG